MTYTRNFLLLFLSIGLLFASCTEDDSLSSTDADFSTEQASSTQLLNARIAANPNLDPTLNPPRRPDINPGLKRPKDPHGPSSDIDNTLALQWTELYLELERYALGMRPNASARAMAYIQLATYETVLPGMRNYNTTQGMLQGFKLKNERKPQKIDWQIALNTAYATSLDHFLLNVPADRKATIAILESEINALLDDDKNQKVVADSKEWGKYVATEVIAFSETDLAAEQQILDPQPISYVPPTGEGYWTFSADAERGLFPYWESVRTFVISPNETSSLPPLDYSEDTNSEYYQQMMEAYTVNNTAKAENNDELAQAEFWSDDVEGLMMSPPARQLSIAAQLAEQKDLNLSETLALFMKLGFSLNDAAVSTWKYKYEYMVMRPSVYIHEFIDPDFQTNLYKFIYWPNPTFPGYPSGHSCFASAAAGVFINAFGNDINFTDRTHEGRTEFISTPRSFSTFTEMADENAYARIPLGVHVRMDCTEGVRLGYEISDAVNELKLKKDPS